MTYRKFLVALRKTDRNWHLKIFTKALRNGWQCPITEVAQEDGLEGVDSAECWLQAGRHLGLAHKTMARLVLASDNTIEHDPATRHDLLRACGVSE